MTLDDYNLLRENMLEVVKLSNDKDELEEKVSTLETDCEDLQHKMNKISKKLKSTTDKKHFNDIRLDLSEREIGIKSLKTKKRELESQNEEIKVKDNQTIAVGCAWIIGMILIWLLVDIFGLTYDFSGKDWFFVPESCETVADCEEDNHEITWMYSAFIVSVTCFTFYGIVENANNQKRGTRFLNNSEIREIEEQIRNESRFVRNCRKNLDDYMALEHKIPKNRETIKQSQDKINMIQNKIQALLKEVEYLAPYSDRL